MTSHDVMQTEGLVHRLKERAQPLSKMRIHLIVK